MSSERWVLENAIDSDLKDLIDRMETKYPSAATGLLVVQLVRELQALNTNVADVLQEIRNMREER